jgi:hypothetical protein
MNFQISPYKSFNLVTWRQQLLVAIIYGAIAISLLSPMASAVVMPNIADAIINVSHTIQARMALEEGQFPLRVAPWQHNGWRYPVFQFYGQFIYTFTGLVYQHVTPTNPYLACLIALWLALTVSGFFIYRTSLLLTRSAPAAILAGGSYMAAPYFLVNIHARGAFAEAVAQGVLPVVLYCVIHYYLKPSLDYVLLGGVAWFVLATTHTITFIYSSLFIGLFLLLLGIFKRNTWKEIKGIFLSYCLGWLLSLYFLAPVILSSTNLQIRDSFVPPYYLNWLTPLPTLLQPVSLPPEPQPGVYALNDRTPNLHTAVGWVMLIAWSTVIYYYFSRQSWPSKLQQTRYFVAPLLVLFILAFFLTWSPFDFWQFLPQPLWVTQFTYRLMTHAMWTGALLCAYAIVLLFRGRLDGRHIVLGLLLINMASSSYLPRLSSSKIAIDDLIKQPDLGYGSAAYLYKGKLDKLELLQDISKFVHSDQWLKLDVEQEIFLFPGDSIVLHLEGEVPLEWFNKPISISVIVDNKKQYKQLLKTGKFNWNIPIKIPRDSNRFRLKFLTNNFIIPKLIDPTSPDERHLAIRVINLQLRGGVLSDYFLVPVTKTIPTLHQKGVETTGEVIISNKAHLVQLPVLYYPELLEVYVDGKKNSYFGLPKSDEGFALTSLVVPPGSHKISVLFKGLSWANWSSGIAWLVLIVITAFIWLRKMMNLVKSKTRIILKN